MRAFRIHSLVVPVGKIGLLLFHSEPIIHRRVSESLSVEWQWRSAKGLKYVGRLTWASAMNVIVVVYR